MRTFSVLPASQTYRRSWGAPRWVRVEAPSAHRSLQLCNCILKFLFFLCAVQMGIGSFQHCLGMLKLLQSDQPPSESQILACGRAVYSSLVHYTRENKLFSQDVLVPNKAHRFVCHTFIWVRNLWNNLMYLRFQTGRVPTKEKKLLISMKDTTLSHTYLERGREIVSAYIAVITHFSFQQYQLSKAIEYWCCTWSTERMGCFMVLNSIHGWMSQVMEAFTTPLERPLYCLLDFISKEFYFLFSWAACFFLKK